MRALGVAAVVAISLIPAACGDDEPDTDAAPTTFDDANEEIDFDTLDANGDSYLDLDEIAESADTDGLFDTWDADRDSELDSDEIAGNAFGLWDIDNNGSVSEEEWKQATELWYPADTRPTVFGDWDGDGDSELDGDEVSERFDLSELGEAWTEDMDKNTFKRAYFTLYDTDDDGKVTESEFISGASTFGGPEE